MCDQCSCRASSMCDAIRPWELDLAHSSESSVSCNMASPKALETDALQHLKPIMWCRSPKPSSRCPQHWCVPGQDYTLYHCIGWHVVPYLTMIWLMTHDWLKLINVAQVEFFVPWVLSPFFSPARFCMLSMPKHTSARCPALLYKLQAILAICDSLPW